MNIWFLSSEVPWHETGGIARYTQNLALALAQRGHQVTWIGFSNQNIERELAPNLQMFEIGAPSVEIQQAQYQGNADRHPAWPYNILSDVPARSWHMAQKVAELLTRLPAPDVIESQEFRGLPYYLLQNKLLGDRTLQQIPLLVHLHSPSFELKRINHQSRYRFPHYWIGQMEKFSIVAADAVVSPSQFLAERMRQEITPSLEITNIPLPLGQVPPPVADSSPSNEIVYCGRLQRCKGVMELVQACARRWEQGDTFQLTLIGGDTQDTSQRTTIATFLQQRYAKWIGEKRLTLTGALPQEAMFARLRNACLAVIPSLWENFPNTCMEAMAIGQLVLASRTGGQAEMIAKDGENGFLFDWHVPGEFEHQLVRALSLPAHERTRITQNARERILSLCDPALVVQQRLAHYQQVVATHQLKSTFPVVHHNFQAQSVTLSKRNSIPNHQREHLSVIIPFYNLGAYVEATLDSILQAETKPTEVLIVNDGSTDAASLAVLKHLEAKQIPQLRILHTENQGLAATRNYGVAMAQSEFIAFVDADDLVERTFFTRALAVLQRYSNVSFVYSWVRFFEGANDIWPTWNTEFPYLLAHNMLIPLVVVRRHDFLQAGKNHSELSSYYEDFSGWLGLALAGGIGVSIPEPLVRYRVRAGSMSRSVSNEERLVMYEALTKHHSAAYQQWGEELFHLQNANGPAFLWNHPAAAPQTLVTVAQLNAYGVSLSDNSLQLAARLIFRMRQNKLFRQLIQYPALYRFLRTAVKQLFGKSR